MIIRTPTFAGIQKTLSDVDILQDLPAEELWNLSTLACEHAYRKGELIEGIGREGGGVFAVLQGAVRLYLAALDGRQITLRYRHTGQAFELHGEEGESRVATLGQAVTNHTIVASMPWATFIEVLQPRSSHVIETLLRQALEEERWTVQEFAFSSVKARLAHKLAVLAQMGLSGVVQETRDELAAMVGTRPEEVTKLLAELRKAHLVSYEPYDRTIVVLESELLADL